MKWIYNSNKFDKSLINDNIGFVYRITQVDNGKMYIGKKLFVFKVCKKPLKGKKNKRRSVKESDWEKYQTSSREIQEICKNEGEDSFIWEILSLHKSKSRLAYEEAKLQFMEDVLLSEKYYNGIINCRISKILD